MFFFLFPFLFFNRITSELPLVSSDDQLVLLVDQVYPNITTYLDKGQISELFNEYVKVLRTAETIEEMVRDMRRPFTTVLTPDQKKETLESVQKAQNGFGGFYRLKIIMHHAMEDVQSHVGDFVKHDRAIITKNSKGISENEVKSMILEALREYFTVEFVQEIIDIVKYSMAKEDWKIATADASKYINVTNFDLFYWHSAL